MTNQMTPQPADAELVQSAKAGDLEAFEILTTRHEQRVYSLAMRMLRQEQDAEDVTQQTFLSVVENLAGFRGPRLIRSRVQQALRPNAADYSASPDEALIEIEVQKRCIGKPPNRIPFTLGATLPTLDLRSIPEMRGVTVSTGPRVPSVVMCSNRVGFRPRICA